MTQNWARDVGGQRQVGSMRGLRLPAWLPAGALSGTGTDKASNQPVWSCLDFTAQPGAGAAVDPL